MAMAAQASEGRHALWRLAPPKPLAALLAIVCVVGLAWALIVPPFQTPDELAHYAYVESIAQRSSLPGGARPYASSDENFADGSVGASAGAFYPRMRPPDWSSGDFRAYLAAVGGPAPPARDNGGGQSSASQNPPLYYMFAQIGYLAGAGGTTFTRLYSMRLSGVLLLLVTTVGAWLLAGEVFERRRLPQLGCAAVTGLLPMQTFISTSVNPDALTITLWTLALWLGARVINRAARAPDAIALCALTAAAILTKASSYALGVAAVFALLAGWRRIPAPERRRALRRVCAAVLVLVVPVLAWWAYTRSTGRVAINTVGSSPAHPFQVGQFLSYLWQFYLPRLPMMTPLRATPQIPAYVIWLNQGTGVFGWLDVYLPGWLYPVAAWSLAVVAAGALAVIAGLGRRINAPLLGFFALALICLLGILHITDYRVLIDGGGQFLQARYLLPTLGLLGLAVGLIIDNLPRPAKPAVGGLTLSVLLAVQTVALASVVQIYYL